MQSVSLLIHIGYHKTGTSWLQERLFSNADFGFESPITPDEIRDHLVVQNPLRFCADAVQGIHLSTHSVVNRARDVSGYLA